MLPPKSDPQSNAAMPSATAAAPPPLEPPDVRARSVGCDVAPITEHADSGVNARSERLDFPSRTAPDFWSARKTGLLLVGIRCACRREPPVVGIPSVSQTSLST